MNTLNTIKNFSNYSFENINFEDKTCQIYSVATGKELSISFKNDNMYANLKKDGKKHSSSVNVSALIEKYSTVLIEKFDEAIENTEVPEVIEEPKAKKTVKNNGGMPKPVVMFTPNGDQFEFSSLSELAKELGVKPAKVSILVNRTKTLLDDGSAAPSRGKYKGYRFLVL